MLPMLKIGLSMQPCVAYLPQWYLRSFQPCSPGAAVHTVRLIKTTTKVVFLLDCLQ